MQRVRDLLKSKTKEVWSISPKSMVFDALKIMDEKEIGALMVMDKKDKVVGIIKVKQKRCGLFHQSQRYLMP